MTIAKEQTSEPVIRINLNRIASVLVWSGSVWTTAVFVASLGVSSPELLFVSIGIQMILTALESGIWKGKTNTLDYIALVLDIFINMGGMWVWIRNVDQTQTWAMLSEVWGAPSELSGVAKVAIAGVVAVLLAYAPEGIWKKG